MTDSKIATELRELCEMLDEQGIEWTKGDAAYQIEWTNRNGQRCSAMYWKPTLSVLISKCTPEQAIAATLGSGECEWMLKHSGPFYDKWRCSSCGFQFVEPRCAQGYMDLEPNYCPNCGKAVKR